MSGTGDFSKGSLLSDPLLRLFLSASSACALLALYFYADLAYPHGPTVFAGYDSVCDKNGRLCREVPVYKEDTSGLDNPAWVLWTRKLGWFPLIPAAVLGLVALGQVSEIKKKRSEGLAADQTRGHAKGGREGAGGPRRRAGR